MYVCLSQAKTTIVECEFSVQNERSFQCRYLVIEKALQIATLHNTGFSFFPNEKAKITLKYSLCYQKGNFHAFAQIYP